MKILTTSVFVLFSLTKGVITHKYNLSSSISSEWNNASRQQRHSYLDQGAVAIPRRLFVKVIMVEDGDKATDHRFKGSGVLLDLSHTCDQAAGNSAVRRTRGCTRHRNDVFTGPLQGCKHNLVIHT